SLFPSVRPSWRPDAVRTSRGRRAERPSDAGDAASRSHAHRRPEPIAEPPGSEGTFASSSSSSTIAGAGGARRSSSGASTGGVTPVDAGYDEEQEKGSPTQCAPTWASPVATTPLSLLTPAAVCGSWLLLLAPFGSTTDGRTAAVAAVVDPGGHSRCTGRAAPPSPQPSQVAGVVCSVEEIQRRDMACGATTSIRNREIGL
ncbi:unnamed protein product, partial [Urochloa humidicola]